MHWLDRETETVGDSESTDQGCVALVKRDKRIAKRAWLRDFGWYCVRAFVMVAVLAFARDCSPVLPAWALPFIFLIYAIPATIGSMYGVVTHRLHRQELYNEHGKLSHYNRRWFVWFGGFFTLYLVSALAFVLQAPSWSGEEWLFVWAAPIAFYLVFLAVRFFCKREYDTKYYKAKAIKWSIVIAALILTIFYVVASLQPPVEPHIDLHQILQERNLSYADSPAPFLAELDKLSTYAGCLTEYGVSLISKTSYVISIIVNLVLGFSIFVGVTSQLGACLLNWDEIGGEFRLLPANHSKREAVQSKYFVILVAIFIVFYGIFIMLNHIADEIRSTEEYTLVDQWIDDTSDWVILAAEQDIEVIKEDIELVSNAHSFNQQFVEERDSFIDEQRPKTIQQLNDYYDACIDRVDAYVDWCNGVPVSIGRIIPIFGENMMSDEFDRQIIDPVSTSDVDIQYGAYLHGLEDFYDDYMNAEETSILPSQIAMPKASDIIEKAGIPDGPRLWLSWDSEGGKKVIQEVLLGKGAQSDDLKERIVTYIEDQRQKTIAQVESMSVVLFPSSLLDSQ